MTSGIRSTLARSTPPVNPFASTSALSWVAAAAKRAWSMVNGASVRRSARAVSVTWPRDTVRRIASRTSVSQRPNALGSLMLGKKNRWFTVRTSTTTRSVPTAPSACPNPVMERIIPE